MFNKNSCINLGIIFPVNHIICFILRNFGMKQDCPVIEFRHFRVFAMTVYLNLFWIDLGSTTIPSFSYP